MLTPTGVPAFVGSFVHASLFFARQREPDMEFTEDDLASAAPQSASPAPSPGRSKRPIKWILVLALLGVMAYVAMDPDMVIRALEPYLGDNEPTAVPSSRNAPAAQAPSSPGTSSNSESAPTLSAAPPPTATPTTPNESSPVGMQGPLFAEGQKVSVVPDPLKPGAAIQLTADAAGTKPGVSVPAGAAMTVLDGELLASGWTYAVLTEDGRQGWVAEKHLKFRR